MRGARALLGVSQLLLVALGLAACTQFEPRAGLQEVQAEVRTRSQATVHWRGNAAADQLMDARVDEIIARPITENDAVEIALVRHPALQARYEMLGVAQADLVQAGLLKNLSLTIQPQWPGRPQVPLEIDIVGGFLDILYMPLRKKVAKAEFARVQAEVAAEILARVREVRIAYHRARAAEDEVVLYKAMNEAASISAEFARRMRGAGNMTALEKATIDAAAEESHLEMLAALAEAEESQISLATLLALPPGTKITMYPTIEAPLWESWQTEQLEALALAKRIELMGARQSLAAIEAEGKLVRAGALLLEGGELGVKVDRESDGKWLAGPSITVPLPLFDQGQASTGKVEARWRQARAELAAMENDVRGNVRKAFAQWNAAKIRAHRLARTIVPLREMIMAETQLEFNAMQVGIFDLLRAKRDEIHMKIQSREAAKNYWVNRIELETAVGTHLPVPSATAPAATMPVDAPAITQPAEDPHRHHSH